MKCHHDCPDLQQVYYRGGLIYRHCWRYRQEAFLGAECALLKSGDSKLLANQEKPADLALNASLSEQNRDLRENHD